MILVLQEGFRKSVFCDFRLSWGSKYRDLNLESDLPFPTRSNKSEVVGSRKSEVGSRARLVRWTGNLA